MRNRTICKCLTILVVLLLNVAVFAGFDTGETYHGFELKEKKFVKEVNAKCFLFEHSKSGARLLKIAADDPNKTFSIAFKTVPQSDAGTPHIMEHSVLNGSKNFPVKSPFDILARGSLNTFLNAMTGSDITIYPVASMNNKDYFNLMHVYLDAVFNPLIYDDPRILKQEGWHYELTDKDAPVVYKGVVYNEMKGAFSSPTRELGFQLQKNLFPDNGYGLSSGGYPTAIPTLTQEAFIDFHKKYYHPSNSYIFLYGDADLDKELSFINSAYLSNYEKSDAKAFIPLQDSFAKMKKVMAYYPAAEGSATEDQTYLSLGYVCGKNTDQKLVFALDILSDVLVNQEAAPVRKALQEAGIGKEVRASVDPMKQNVFEIRVQNANPEENEKFLAIVETTLKRVADEGLDMEAVEGILNRLEFRKREGNDAQKGLTYNFNVLNGWFFAEDPFLSLEWEKPLAAIKADMQKGYLEKVIKSHLLDNPHAVLLTLEPKPGMEKETNARIAEELQAYKASLSDQEIENLIEETQSLIEYQKREDTAEALATIPMLDLEDIDPRTEWYKVTEKNIGDVPLLHYDTFTNDVVYTRLYLDAKVLPQELVPYAALLSEVLSSLNTEKFDYGELDKQLNLHTGGFNTFLGSYLGEQNDDNLMPMFIVQAKAMNNKVDQMLRLTDEIINHTRFTDKERLKAVLTRHQSRLDANVKSNGFGIAITRMRSYFTNAGQFEEKTNGLDYYWFVTDLVNSFDDRYERLIDKLEKTARLLFNRNHAMVSVTCSSDDLKNVTALMEEFLGRLPDEPVTMEEWTFTTDMKNEGLLSASKVQYVLQGYDFKELGYEWNGKMRVLEQILSRDWLTNQIRVIGGAYGGFSSIQPNGQIFFGSYRDPNLTETLENFDGTVDYLNAFDADKETLTRFIIGTIARMDRPLTASQQGNRAVEYYFEKTTADDVQQEREAVLNTSTEDIRSMRQLIADFLSQNTYCVYGNEEKLKANQSLFNDLKQVSK